MTINHVNAGPNRALKHSSKKQAGKSGNSDVIRLQDHSSFTNLRARVNHRKKKEVPPFYMTKVITTCYLEIGIFPKLSIKLLSNCLINPRSNQLLARDFI